MPLHSQSVKTAIEPQVQVAAAGNLDRPHARNRRQARGQLLGNRTRRLAHETRQTEGDGQRELAE